MADYCLRFNCKNDTTDGDTNGSYGILPATLFNNRTNFSIQIKLRITPPEEGYVPQYINVNEHPSLFDCNPCITGTDAEDDTCDNSFCFNIPIINGNLSFYSYRGNCSIISNSNITDGNIHMITFTFDGTYVKLYDNNTQAISTDALKGKCITNRNFALFATYNSDKICSNINGKMYELRVWNKALSADEIINYNTNNVNGTETDLCALYKYTITKDSCNILHSKVNTDATNDIHLYNTQIAEYTVYTKEEVIGNYCLHFNGKNYESYLETDYFGNSYGTLPAAVLANKTIFSIQMKLKLYTDDIVYNSTISIEDIYPLIYSENNDDASFLNLYIGIEDGALVLDMPGFNIQYSNMNIEDGQIHMITFTFDINANCKLYLDNDLIINTDIYKGLKPNNKDFLLFKGMKPGQNYEYLAANLYELRIWNKVLTDNEISAYNSTLIGNEDGLIALYLCNEKKGNILNDKINPTLNNITLYDTSWIYEGNNDPNYTILKEDMISSLDLTSYGNYDWLSYTWDEVLCNKNTDNHYISSFELPLGSMNDNYDIEDIGVSWSDGTEPNVTYNDKVTYVYPTSLNDEIYWDVTLTDVSQIIHVGTFGILQLIIENDGKVVASVKNYCEQYSVISIKLSTLPSNKLHFRWRPITCGSNGIFFIAIGNSLRLPVVNINNHVQGYKPYFIKEYKAFGMLPQSIMSEQNIFTFEMKFALIPNPDVINEYKTNNQKNNNVYQGDTLLYVNNYNEACINMCVNPNGGYIGGYVGNSSNNSICNFYSNISVIDCLPHRISISYNGNIIKFYIDGMQMGSNIPCTETIGKRISLFGRGRIDGDNVECPFNGILYDIRYWKRALSGDEISYYNDKELMGKENGLSHLYLCNEMNTDYLKDELSEDAISIRNIVWTSCNDFKADCINIINYNLLSTFDLDKYGTIDWRVHTMSCIRSSLAVEKKNTDKHVISRFICTNMKMDDTIYLDNCYEWNNGTLIGNQISRYAVSTSLPNTHLTFNVTLNNANQCIYITCSNPLCIQIKQDNVLVYTLRAWNINSKVYKIQFNNITSESIISFDMCSLSKDSNECALKIGPIAVGVNIELINKFLIQDNNDLMSFDNSFSKYVKIGSAPATKDLFITYGNDQLYSTREGLTSDTPKVLMFSNDIESVHQLKQTYIPKISSTVESYADNTKIGSTEITTNSESQHVSLSNFDVSSLGANTNHTYQIKLIQNGNVISTATINATIKEVKTIITDVTEIKAFVEINEISDDLMLTSKVDVNTNYVLTGYAKYQFHSADYGTFIYKFDDDNYKNSIVFSNLFDLPVELENRMFKYVINVLDTSTSYTDGTSNIMIQNENGALVLAKGNSNFNYNNKDIHYVVSLESLLTDTKKHYENIFPNDDIYHGIVNNRFSVKDNKIDMDVRLPYITLPSGENINPTFSIIIEKIYQDDAFINYFFKSTGTKTSSTNSDEVIFSSDYSALVNESIQDIIQVQAFRDLLITSMSQVNTTDISISKTNMFSSSKKYTSYDVEVKTDNPDIRIIKTEILSPLESNNPLIRVYIKGDESATAQWKPKIHNGYYYIGSDEYYLYSESNINGNFTEIKDKTTQENYVNFIVNINLQKVLGTPQNKVLDFNNELSFIDTTDHQNNYIYNTLGLSPVPCINTKFYKEYYSVQEYLSQPITVNGGIKTLGNITFKCTNGHISDSATCKLYMKSYINTTWNDWVQVNDGNVPGIPISDTIQFKIVFTNYNNIIGRSDISETDSCNLDFINSMNKDLSTNIIITNDTISSNIPYSRDSRYVSNVFDYGDKTAIFDFSKFKVHKSSNVTFYICVTNDYVAINNYSSIKDWKDINVLKESGTVLTGRFMIYRIDFGYSNKIEHVYQIERIVNLNNNIADTASVQEIKISYDTLNVINQNTIVKRYSYKIPFDMMQHTVINDLYVDMAQAINALGYVDTDVKSLDIQNLSDYIATIIYEKNIHTSISFTSKNTLLVENTKCKFLNLINNTAILSPRPQQFAPICIAANNIPLKQVNFYDDDGNLTLEYTENIISNGQKIFKLKYNDIDIKSIIIKVDGNIIDNSINYSINGNLLMFENETIVNSLYTITYKINNSFVAMYNYDENENKESIDNSSDKIKILINPDVNIANTTIAYETNKNENKKTLDNISLNPLFNVYNKGFIYADYSEYVVDKIEIHTNPLWLKADGKDNINVFVFIKDSVGNAFSGEEINILINDIDYTTYTNASLYMQNTTSDENGIIAFVFSTTTVGNNKITVISKTNPNIKDEIIIEGK